MRYRGKLLDYGRMESTISDPSVAAQMGMRVGIPAGLSDVVFEPRYSLITTKTDYVSDLAPNTPKTKLPHPMPIAITFFAEQGEESTLIKIGTAYESATHHRIPAPAFGPVASQSGGATSTR